MFQCVAHVLLVVALVSAGGSAPFAHVHPHGSHHTAPPPEEARADSHSAHQQRHRHAQGQGAHWHLSGRQAADGPATATLVPNAHQNPPVAVSVSMVAVERLGVRGGGTPALAEGWEAGTVPDPPGRPLAVAAKAGPNNPPPRLRLVARAPPG